MNIEAAKQAAAALDLQLRSGGVQAALASLDLLKAIAEAVREAQADAEAEAPVAPTKKEGE